MSAGIDDLFGQLQVVVERVQSFVRIRQITGVAQRHLREGRSGLTHRVDGRPHLVDVVERVEDSEDVDTGVGGFLNECARDLFGIRRVAHRVSTAKKHLEADVGNRLTQCGKPVPRILVQEAKSHIVGRAAPGFDREQFRRQPRNVPGYSEQSAGPNSRGQQRLVRVTEGGVGDADGLLLTQRLRETFGSEFEQSLTATGRRRRREIDLGQLVLRVHRRGPLTVRLVDRHIREVGQDLRAAVCRRTQSQQLRTFLDEGGRHASGPEVRVVENRL